MTERINLIIVILILIALAFMFGCKDKAEADEPAYQAIYDRALSAEEIAKIHDDLFYEPDEPKQKHNVVYDGTWTNFWCDGKLFRTIVGDGNISGNCPICDDFVQTSGAERNKKVFEISKLEPNEPKQKPLNPKLNKSHPLSEGLTSFELFIPTKH